MLEKKNTSLAKPLSFLSMHSIVFGIQWDCFFPRQTYFPRYEFVFAAAYLLFLYMNECSSGCRHSIWPVLCEQAHFSVWPSVCGNSSHTVPSLFPPCRTQQWAAQCVAAVVLLCICSCSFAKAVKRFEMGGERGVCEITCSVVGERSHTARCVVVWLCCFTMPSKQEHCVTVGGFHCNNQTHWITLCTLHTPFGNGAFTPIDTLPFAATTNKISVWVESCWVCISCLPFCEFS